MKVEALVFAIDDVLYDTSQQLSASRMSAVRAMREAGLPADVETAYRKLEEIAKETGPDDTKHFDRLLERLGLKWNPEVIAAGVVAYRATSPIYLNAVPGHRPHSPEAQRRRIQARSCVQRPSREAMAKTDPARAGTHVPRRHHFRGGRI